MYRNEEGLAICRHSYCALIDILGFTEQTRAAASKNETNALLQSIAASLKVAAENLDSYKPGTFWNYKFFSDNVVLGIPHRGGWEDAESEFGSIIFQIADYQMQMSLDGLFTRGGLAYGDLHMSKNLVYGVALIDAYETETKKSIYPRIVLHQSALVKLRQQLASYSTAAGAPQDHHLLVDQDGEVFVNYLSALVPDIDVLLEDALLQHRNSIARALTNYKSNERVLLKYQWLAQYHNFFCKEFASTRSENVDRFLVEENLGERFSRLGKVYR